MFTRLASSTRMAERVGWATGTPAPSILYKFERRVDSVSLVTEIGPDRVRKMGGVGRGDSPSS